MPIFTRLPAPMMLPAKVVDVLSPPVVRIQPVTLGSGPKTTLLPVDDPLIDATVWLS